MSEHQPLYVFGASGHGKVVAESARAHHLAEVRGFLDDDPARHGLLLTGLPVVGGLEAIANDIGRVAVALGIGSNRARLAVFSRLVAAGHSLATIVHPSAVIADSATLGDGTFVAPLALVHADARLGRACIVNSGAVVEHDNVLGDGVHVSPNAALGGNVTLGDEVHVGLGAVVLPGITVGARAVVGAGAVVIADVPEGVTVVGVPARSR
jgi:sugar O-acyltransferase (sialic acid O-acetyltransferase NeuD family)